MSGPIVAIPTTYAEVRFRSALEADWAATFDRLGWAWQYETTGVLVDGLAYLPDFYLPAQNVYAEVKGPHDERLRKTEALARSLSVVDTDDPVASIRPPDWQTLVVLRTAERGVADWHDITGPATSSVVIALCPECESHTFTDLAGTWWCRVCRSRVTLEQWREVIRPASWDETNGLLAGSTVLSLCKVARGRVDGAA